MRDLLIAADLVHVVRGGKGTADASFIGQDKLADTSMLAAAGRIFQVGSRSLGVGGLGKRAKGGRVCLACLPACLGDILDGSP